MRFSLGLAASVVVVAATVGCAAPKDKPLAEATSVETVFTTTTTTTTATTATKAPTTTTATKAPATFDWAAANQKWNQHFKSVIFNVDMSTLYVKLDHGKLEGAHQKCQAGIRNLETAPIIVSPSLDLNNYLAQANEAARVMFEGCLNSDGTTMETGAAAFEAALKSANMLIVMDVLIKRYGY